MIADYSSRLDRFKHLLSHDMKSLLQRDVEMSKKKPTSPKMGHKTTMMRMKT
jgi:hypothetical protein